MGWGWPMGDWQLRQTVMMKAETQAELTRSGWKLGFPYLELTGECSRWELILGFLYRLKVSMAESRPMGHHRDFRPRAACSHALRFPLRRRLIPSPATPSFSLKQASRWNERGLRPVAISVRRRDHPVA
jgi:hypothetical protein